MSPLDFKLVDPADILAAAPLSGWGTVRASPLVLSYMVADGVLHAQRCPSAGRDVFQVRLTGAGRSRRSS